MNDGTASNWNDVLTLKKLQEAIDLCYPVLYYAFNEFMPKGQIYHIKKTDFNPEYIVLNIADFEEVKNKIPSRRLVSIREAPNPYSQIIKFDFDKEK